MTYHSFVSDDAGDSDPLGGGASYVASIPYMGLSNCIASLGSWTARGKQQQQPNRYRIKLSPALALVICVYHTRTR